MSENIKVIKIDGSNIENIKKSINEILDEIIEEEKEELPYTKVEIDEIIRKLYALTILVAKENKRKKIIGKLDKLLKAPHEVKCSALNFVFGNVEMLTRFIFVLEKLDGAISLFEGLKKWQNEECSQKQ